MTVVVPEWLIWVFIVMTMVSVFFSALHIRVQRELGRMRGKLHTERVVLNQNIGKLMTKVIEDDRNNRARNVRYTDLEYLDIKSPLIKTDIDSKGRTLLAFGNGVVVARGKRSTSVVMDS